MSNGKAYLIGQEEIGEDGSMVEYNLKLEPAIQSKKVDIEVEYMDIWVINHSDNQYMGVCVYDKGKNYEVSLNNGNDKWRAYVGDPHGGVAGKEIGRGRGSVENAVSRIDYEYISNPDSKEDAAVVATEML